MLWFTAFLITCVLTGLGTALFWLAGADLPPISDALRAVLPGPFAPRGLETWIILGSITGCYAIVRTLVQLTFAYTGSAVESSPRGDRSRSRRPGQRREQFGGAAARWFASPTGGWLSSYTLILGLVAFVSFPMVLTGVVHPVIWGLTALYSLTVARTALWPDPVAPLVTGPDNIEFASTGRAAPWGTIEPLEPEEEVRSSPTMPIRSMATAPTVERSNPTSGQPVADAWNQSATVRTEIASPPPLIRPIPSTAEQPSVRPQSPSGAADTGSQSAAASVIFETDVTGYQVEPPGYPVKKPVRRGWRFWKKSAAAVTGETAPLATTANTVTADLIPPQGSAPIADPEPLISPPPVVPVVAEGTLPPVATNGLNESRPGGAPGSEPTTTG